MQDTIDQIKSFYQEKINNDVLIKTGQVVVILFVVIVAQLLLAAIVGVINSIPIVSGLLQLVGLVTVILFAKDNLLTVEQRQTVIYKIKSYFNDQNESN